MTLRFCPKCKTLMSPHKKNNSIFLKCPRCDFSRILGEKDFLITKESIVLPEPKGKGVVDDKNKFATYNHICEKCGYNKAQILDLGIFYSDEDNLILLKCGRCGWSERIGRKTS